MVIKKRIHVQLVLSGNEIGWYDNLDNRAKVFKAFIERETFEYNKQLEENYQAHLDRLEKAGVY
jgi:hypothetical protein